MADQGLVLEKMEIRLGDRIVVAFNAQIAPGEILTVMGPSGVGKSTLLAAISGTLAPAFDMTGRIVLNGVDLTNVAVEARHIGMLFQDDLLFPHLSVGDNMAFGLSQRIRGRAVRRSRVADALAEVGLEGFAHRDPDTLSGGQKARVALMRMLLSEPRAILLDEAFSKLDTERRAQVRDLVFQLVKARGLPVLQVTHDPSDAEAAGGPIHRLT